MQGTRSGAGAGQALLLVAMCAIATLFSMPGSAAQAQARLQKLTLAGPFAAVSYPLIHMVDTGALKDVAAEVEFVLWKDPDQLRVLAMQGNSDFIAMPTNVAANLYNRGVQLQLLNVSTWGVLWMVSRDANLKTLADFRGREIVMPFRADMPDIIFQLLAARAGLDAKRDFSLRYVASPLDAMQLLIMRRADNALLAEPAVSTALRKTHSFPISLVAPELYRSVDLQQEWGRLLDRPPRIPQAGIVAMGSALGSPELIARFQEAYASALQWCEAHPDECGQAVARRVEMLTPEGVADSVRIDNATFVSAEAARPELEFFFAQLHASQPGLIGGKLPDAGFYYQPAPAAQAPAQP